MTYLLLIQQCCSPLRACCCSSGFLACLSFRGTESGGTVAQGRGGVSFSGDIQALPGHGAVQPALGDPAWAGGWAG